MKNANIRKKSNCYIECSWTFLAYELKFGRKVWNKCQISVFWLKPFPRKFFPFYENLFVLKKIPLNNWKKISNSIWIKEIWTKELDPLLVWLPLFNFVSMVYLPERVNYVVSSKWRHLSYWKTDLEIRYSLDSRDFEINGNYIQISFLFQFWINLGYILYYFR